MKLNKARYNLRATAEILDISYSKLRGLIAQGRRTKGREGIWPIQVDGQRQYVPAEVIERHLDACTVKI